MEVIVLGAVVFGLAYAFTHRGGTRAGSDDWQPGHTAAATGQRHVAFGTQRSASVQLARIEGRQLLRNEVFIVAIAMSIAILVIFGVIWASNNLDMSLGHVVLGSIGTSGIPYQSTWTQSVSNSTKYRYVAFVKTANEYFFIAEARVLGSP